VALTTCPHPANALNAGGGGFTGGCDSGRFISLPGGGASLIFLTGAAVLTAPARPQKGTVGRGHRLSARWSHRFNVLFIACKASAAK
jgi:hypothetical protein